MKIFYTLLCIILFSCDTEYKKHVSKSNGKRPPGKITAPAGYINVAADKNIEDKLCQCWENENDLEQIEQYGVSEELEFVLRGYCFYKNGIMVKNVRGYMEIGKWKIDSSTRPLSIRMRLKNNELLLPIERVTATKLISREEKELQQYKSIGFRHLNDLNDPFYPTNNIWRIKPQNAETPAQIKARLKGCIHFFVLYYTEMINTNAPSVLFAGLPSCFTWYAGGIYIQKKSELQQKWVDCFYNTQQAMQAYDIAAKLLQQKYTWPEKENNWMVLNVSVLKQMEQRLDSLN